MAHRGRHGANAQLVAVLAGGATAQAAAKLTGVSPRTVFRRLADPTFRRRVTRARSELLDRALGHLTQGSIEASVTLRKLLRLKGDARIQLGAARTILELGAKLKDAADVEERLRRLEEAVERNGGYDNEHF